MNETVGAAHSSGDYQALLKEVTELELRKLLFLSKISYFVFEMFASKHFYFLLVPMLDVYKNELLIKRFGMRLLHLVVSLRRKV